MPGAADGAGGGAATLGYDSKTRLTPLTVNLGEFAEKIGDENREIVQYGWFFQWDEEVREKHNVPMGPVNPQALNRYSYTLNDPLRYVDPTGHIKVEDDLKAPPPPEWLQNITIIWRTPPTWIKDLLFNPTGGTRIIQIGHPHQGAEYWHINSDLKLLSEKWLNLDHQDIEPLLAQAAAAKATVDATISALAKSKCVVILENAPVMIVPQFMLDPKYMLNLSLPGPYNETND